QAATDCVEAREYFVSAEILRVNSHGHSALACCRVKILRRIVKGYFCERRVSFGQCQVERCGILKSLSRQTQSLCASRCSQFQKVTLSLQQLTVGACATFALRCCLLLRNGRSGGLI